MKIERSRQWLRLTTLTTTAIGTGEGTATVDRPTHRDPASGLPLLPHSALKGVLAAPFDANRNERERVFGSPDDAGKQGRPGPLVLGDAVVVSFPIATAEGSIVHVVPALSLGRALTLELGSLHADVLSLLAALEEHEGSAVAWPQALGVPGVPLKGSVPGALAQAAMAQLFPQLVRLLGRSESRDGYLLVGQALATRLWERAVEVRTLTSVDTTTGTVAEGSLRRTELIPAASRFLCWTTWHASQPAQSLPPRLQVGAGESLGHGWLRLEVVAEPVAVRQAPAGGEDAAPSLAPGPFPTAPAAARLQVAMHRAVARLRDAAAPTRRAAAAAVKAFGPRAHLAGLAAALAFHLARARPRQSTAVTVRQRAHRWLLATLLDLPGEPLEDAAYDSLAEWAQTPGGFDAAAVHAQEAGLMLRWQWLRRHCELGLPAPEPGDEDAA